MVKVLLINSQEVFPVNTASLAGFLLINGFETEILVDDKVDDYLDEYKPDIVGINYTSEKDLNIIKTVKNHNILVVVYGMYATMNAEQLMKEPIDFVIMGEPEIPMINLLNKIKKNDRNPADLKAITYRTPDSLFISPDRILVDALDGLPPPAYELLPMEKYKRKVSMITSRGCPHKCPNCKIVNMWGDVWRVKNVPFVLSEIGILLDVYKIKEIHFADECLTFDVPRIHSLCREIVHRNLQFKWTTGFQFQKPDLQTLRLMEQAGFKGFVEENTYACKKKT